MEVLTQQIPHSLMDKQGQLLQQKVQEQQLSMQKLMIKQFQ
jgi:hypothetical protein